MVRTAASDCMALNRALDNVGSYSYEKCCRDHNIKALAFGPTPRCCNYFDFLFSVNDFVLNMHSRTDAFDVSRCHERDFMTYMVNQPVTGCVNDVHLEYAFFYYFVFEYRVSCVNYFYVDCNDLFAGKPHFGTGNAVLSLSGLLLHLSAPSFFPVYTRYSVRTQIKVL